MRIHGIGDASGRVMRFQKHLRGEIAAATLVETAAAVGLLAIFIAVLVVLSSHVLGLLRTSESNIMANQTLQERMELIHTANWLQITDANYLAAEYLKSDAKSSSALKQPVEVLTVSAYPEKPGMFARIVRENGATRVIAGNPLLKDERMVRVDLALNWQGFPRNRERSRMTTTLVSRTGSNKR
jgi:hypothetical protein